MKRKWSLIAMFVMLLGSAVLANYLNIAGERERPPKGASLAEFPAQFGNWRELDAQTLGTGQLRELNSDDYISRTYVNDRGSIGYLFIAYYSSQRHRQTIHSPQNCVPAAGWTMSDHKLHAMAPGRNGRERAVNEYLIGKDDVKMLAFYWYHGRGRVVASDYLARLYTVQDSIFQARTDGAIVRVIIPMGKHDAAEDQARAAGLDMVKSLLNDLSLYIPD